MSRYDDFETRAVMEQTGCDLETAVRTLEWSRGRIGVAINRILTDRKFEVVRNAE